MEIHPNTKNKGILFSELTQASAVPLARKIIELSSNFIRGRQEDPSEFLVVLFDHLINCLSYIDLPYGTYLSNPLHFIFGMNINSEIKCTICLNKTNKANYETVWSIPIFSHSILEEALTAFCSPQSLTGDNSFDCSTCVAYVPALQSLQLNNVSPVIFIHLKRFVYDTRAKITRKLKHFISYPELLDLNPYIQKNVLHLNQQNYKFNDFIYELYAVSVHLGEAANNGHIFSYVRSPDNLWYKANDELVTPVNVDSVLADNNSYILCYARLLEKNINLSEPVDNTSRLQSARFRFSSTPIRLNGSTNATIDDYSPVRKKFRFLLYVSDLL
jgi:uncharacterized UBP type Zn finger protein